MDRIIYLEKYFSPLWQELSFVEPKNKHIIAQMRQSFGSIVGFEYMKIIINTTQKGKNIIGKNNIKDENLPFHINHHLGLVTDIGEKNELVKQIGDILKTKIKKDIKEQLFYLRVKILQTINLHN